MAAWPFYELSDVRRLYEAAPMFALQRAPQALDFLRRQADEGEELRGALRAYPGMRYEKLDFHYLCLQSLGAMDEKLLSDLARHCGPPGALWAGFLCCLNPSSEARPVLDQAREQLRLGPGNELMGNWILDLAQAIARREIPEPLQAFDAQVERLRDQLHELALPFPRLRRARSEAFCQARAEALRAAYASAGALGARAELKAWDAAPCEFRGQGGGCSARVML